MTSPLHGILCTAEGVALSNDDLLGQFLAYVAGKGLELYPAQEEAILALFTHYDRSAPELALGDPAPRRRSEGRGPRPLADQELACRVHAYRNG